MVSEIRLYVEGGGDQSHTKAIFRKGFSLFLNDLVNIARGKRIRWSIIACGTRNHTYDNFLTALESHQNAFNVLLVDSEGLVSNSPCKYLSEHDNWILNRELIDNCHLMVQIMESWLVADVSTLKSFYGQNFNENAIPRNSDVEMINKDDVKSSLKRATRNTTKGEYHKIRHGPELLGQLNISKIRQASNHCDRLFNTLASVMEASM